MSISGEYVPSPAGWVRDQVEQYEASAGARANTMGESGLPIIVVTMVGHKTGSLRKVPLMRVEHEGEYALVASKGGAPRHPLWYWNLMANPKVQIQDGPKPFDAVVHLATGEERAMWWDRAVAAFDRYAEYQENTEREIPVFIATSTE